jgi:PAT family beta-lactamase induction signal transducer AmpG
MSAPQAVEAPPSLPWRDALKVYLEPASLRMLALGFSAGLPLLLVLGTLSFRLREASVDRSTIGFLSWVVWPTASSGSGGWSTGCRSPLTTLGRRRGWLLLAQMAVIFGLAGMAFNDPRDGLPPLVGARC